MKGIILAGGSGTRLYPMTRVVSKQLLPIYDKPMVYYPLSVLMLAGIRDIMVISTPSDLDRFKELLGDGKRLGIKLHYQVQERPRGLAEAFILAQSFIGNDAVTLILGDNVFYGGGLSGFLQESVANNSGATVFAYPVPDPERFGIVRFDETGKPLEIIEKPVHAPTNLAVTGLYVYNNDVVEIAKHVKPSSRGELEITAVNNEYLKRGSLNVKVLQRGVAWLDTGTPESLHQASAFVEALQKSQNLKISAIEEVAFRKGFISADLLAKDAEELGKGTYATYLRSLARRQK